MTVLRNLPAPEAMGDWANDPFRACRGLDTEAFFPEWGHSNETKRAKKICAECPVLSECRDYALRAVPRVMGIWGGTSERDRELIRGGVS